ncbi:MAG: zinc transporter ZupT [Defluviitaleaceae bacterium]|nr:zinc transporter ZupT [Defluviitaleaceae bacterium]
MLIAFSLTLFAGLATAIGGLIVLFQKKTDLKFMSLCLSFAAGIMIYISFTDIFFKSMEALQYHFEDTYMLIVTVSFFVGLGIMAIIEKFIPQSEISTKEMLQKDINEHLSVTEEKELKKTGIMSAIAVALHNFPEGLIVFLAALYEPAAGVILAIGIAIHNIPEGVAIASPIYYATGSKAKAFWITFISGLTEPLGALLGYFILSSIFTYAVEGISFAFVGGIMVFISFHKLLPTSQKYANHSTVMKGLFAGMAVMAISIVLLT